MSNIEKIKAEIERLENYYTSVEWYVEALLSFIDSLPDENNPEPYNPVYDEDYLNEKIAKATKSWEGVDVDKMLADCRGYEEKPSEELEEEVKNYFEGYWPGTDTPEQCNTDLHFTPLAIMRLARHFAEWGAKCNDSLQVPEICKENQDSFTNGLEEAAEELFETIEIQEHENIFEDTFKKIFIAGAEWMRKKDVEDMYLSDNRHFLKCYEQGKVDMKVDMVEGEIVKDITNMLAVTAKNINLDGFKFGDKVKIIIIKDND